MFHLNLICCHLLNLLPFPLQRKKSIYYKKEICLFAKVARLEDVQYGVMIKLCIIKMHCIE